MHDLGPVDESMLAERDRTVSSVADTGADPGS